MSYYQIEEPIVEPILLEEAKNHLRLSPDFTDDDALIQSLIKGVRAEAEAKTGGRIFPETLWEWVPEGGIPGIANTEIPVSPVREIVGVYDLNTLNDEGEPELIPPSQYIFRKSSLAPNGRPMFATITPVQDTGFSNVKVIVKAGWPNKSETRYKRYEGSPVLEVEKTTYTHNSITLQFNRPVSGEITPKSFTVEVNGGYWDVLDANCINGRVQILFDSIAELTEGSNVTLTYQAGFLKDEDDNYVAPILREMLPDVGEYSEEHEPFPAKEVEEINISTVPNIIKSWMLVRIATIYQQRSEIAIQAGKTSNSFFPRDFVGGLLDAYRLERV